MTTTFTLNDQNIDNPELKVKIDQICIEMSKRFPGTRVRNKGYNSDPIEFIIEFNDKLEAEKYRLSLDTLDNYKYKGEIKENNYHEYRNVKDILS